MIILVLDILRDSLFQFIFNTHSRIFFFPSGWITLLLFLALYIYIPHPPPQQYQEIMQVIQQRQ